MRRYTMLFVTAFALLLLVIAGTAYLAGAGGGEDGGRRAQSQIRVYTTLPAEPAEILANAYEESSGVRVRFVPLTGEEILGKLKEDAGGQGGAALVLAGSSVLQKAAVAGYLVPYISETNDMVPVNLRHAEGFWTGVWYDPVVFAVNRDYMKTLRDVPDTWQALARTSARIGVTDFMASEAAANLLFSQMAQFGDAATLSIWKSIHPRVVQYARYLSNPVRQAGMGEVDIAVAVESEALRYIRDGYPLKIVYPADGTAALVTGTGLALGAGKQDAAQARRFADWLLTDEAQFALQAQSFFFLTTNPDTMAHKSFAGKNIVLFDQPPLFTDAQRKALMDRWAREVRFAP